LRGYVGRFGLHTEFWGLNVLKDLHLVDPEEMVKSHFGSYIVWLGWKTKNIFRMLVVQRAERPTLGRPRKDGRVPLWLIDCESNDLL